jgi:plasmid stabilization system protein ParE
MAHRLAPQAEADLDDIWLYVARDGGSMDVATRLLGSITDRVFFLANSPTLAEAVTRISALDLEASL